MTIKNDGKAAQTEFMELWEEAGAYVYEFQDQAKLVGRNNRMVGSAPMPSDFLVTTDKGTHYAEVKSSHNTTSFPISMIRTTQHGYAKLVTRACEGNYVVYVKNMNTHEWFAVPYKMIAKRIKENVKSIPWELLRVLKLKWNPTT